MGQKVLTGGEFAPSPTAATATLDSPATLRASKVPTLDVDGQRTHRLNSAKKGRDGKFPPLNILCYLSACPLAGAFLSYCLRHKKKNQAHLWAIQTYPFAYWYGKYDVSGAIGGGPAGCSRFPGAD